MAVMHSYPPERQPQPITIGTADLEFGTPGPEWLEFAQGRGRFNVGSFETGSEYEINGFLDFMESRIVSVGRRELEKIESRFEIVGHDAKRGSFHIILELGVVPAAMMTSVPILYKAVKDYKTLRESVILISKDLSAAVKAITDRVRSLYTSFRKAEVTPNTEGIVRLVQAASTNDELEDPTLYDDEAFAKKMETERKALEERVRKAIEEGRLGGGEKI